MVSLEDGFPIGKHFMPKRLLFHGTSGASAWASHQQGKSLEKLTGSHPAETEAVLRSHGVYDLYKKYGNVFPTLLPETYPVKLGVMTISLGFTAGWRLEGVDENGNAHLIHWQNRKAVIPPLKKYFEGLDPVTLGGIEPSEKTFAFSPKRPNKMINGVMFLVERSYMENEKLVKPYSEHQDVEAIYVSNFLPWKAIVGALFFDQDPDAGMVSLEVMAETG